MKGSHEKFSGKQNNKRRHDDSQEDPQDRSNNFPNKPFELKGS